MNIVCEVHSATKRYGNRAVVDGLSFSAMAGQVTALLGPNGSGKTTTLEMLQGLRRPDEGSASLFGLLPTDNAARRRVGVTLQGVDFPENLTAREIIDFASAHYDDPEKTGNLAEAFGLETLLPRVLGGFSGGEKRRVALAIAFAGKPDLVFLDEPTAGLDDPSQEALKEYVTNYARGGGSVILTSHYWPEIEQVADRIVMIDAGRKVLEGGVEEIRERVGLCRVSFDVPNNADWDLDADFGPHSLDGSRHTVATTHGDDLVRHLVCEGVAFSNLAIERVSLKEAIEVYRQTREQGGDF